MKAWITKFTGQYFETSDNSLCSPATATEIKSKAPADADQEAKIQKEMTRLLREQAIKNLGLQPEPIITTDEEPTKP